MELGGCGQAGPHLRRGGQHPGRLVQSPGPRVCQEQDGHREVGDDLDILLTKCYSIIRRYVDFGNEELVPEHRLRRLLNDFLELPALATSVYIPARVTSSSQCDVIEAELRSNLLYQEFRMKVREVSSHGRLSVDLITSESPSIRVSAFVEILKQDQSQNI